MHLNLLATIQKPTARTKDDDDLLRSPFENILKLGVNSMNQPSQSKPQEETYEKLNHMESAPKLPTRSTNPFSEDIRKPTPPPPPSAVTQSSTQGYSATSDQSYWENTDEYQGQTFFSRFSPFSID